MSNLSRSKVPMWVFTFAFFPLGLGGIVLGAAALRHGYQSLRWTVVSGIVLSSHPAASPLVGAIQPDIRYSYNFGEQPFVSNRIWPGDVISSMPVLTTKAGQRLLAQFQTGEQVVVYVNPKDPTDVALIAGPQKAYRWLGVFLFFLLVGFWSPLAISRFFGKKADHV